MSSRTVSEPNNAENDQFLYRNINTVSVALDIVFIHDTFETGQIYSVTHLEPQNIEPILGVEIPRMPMPLRLIPSARCAVLGDGCMGFLASISPKTVLMMIP